MVIFHQTEPLFKTIYIGKIFAVIDTNPGYISSPIPVPQPPLPPEEIGDKPSGFNVLTFVMMIRFPFLTNYLHYYFVIPLTVIYWTLLLFGTYRLIRFVNNKIINKVKDQED